MARLLKKPLIIALAAVILLVIGFAAALIWYAWRNLDGWVAAGRHAPGLRRLKTLTSLATAVPSQLAIAEYLAQGGFDRHLRGLRRQLAAQQARMHALVEAHFPVGTRLARLFADYEPGIHWPQVQMQAAVTWINTPRIYNPVKQARDHDPHGLFVRRWLPALRQVPDTWLFEPWRMPEAMQQRLGLRPGIDLPLPPVDLDAATRLAKQRLFALRARPEIKSAKAAIVEKHGSRQRNALRGTAKSVDLQQLTLDL